MKRFTVEVQFYDMSKFAFDVFKSYVTRIHPQNNLTQEQCYKEAFRFYFKTPQEVINFQTCFTYKLGCSCEFITKTEELIPLVEDENEDQCKVCYTNCNTITKKCKHHLCKLCQFRLVNPICPYCKE